MRLHYIGLGAAAGMGGGFFTFCLFGAFEKGSTAAKVFWALHWPEIVTVKGAVNKNVMFMPVLATGLCGA